MSDSDYSHDAGDIFPGERRRVALSIPTLECLLERIPNVGTQPEPHREVSRRFAMRSHGRPYLFGPAREKPADHCQPSEWRASFAHMAEHEAGHGEADHVHLI